MVWEDLVNTSSSRKEGGDCVNRKKLQRAEKMIREAFVHLYKGLGLLKTYSSLNMEAFRKILKKFEKVSNQRPEAAAFSRKVKRSHFVSSDKVLKLGDEVESIFTQHFTSNDRKKAMKFLRPQRPKESHMVTFFVGLFTGTFVTLFTVYAILAHLCGIFSSTTAQSDYMETVYPIFSVFALISLHVFLYGCNILAWRGCRINHNFIFEFLPNTALKHRDAFLISASLMSAVVAALVAHLLLRSAGILSQKHVDAIPGALLLVFTVWLFLPLNIFYRSTRYCFLRVIRNIVFSPLYKVLMVDFFMADQLTSQIPLLRHMELAACYFMASGFKAHPYETCTRSQQYKLIAYIISFLPYYWRRDVLGEGSKVRLEAVSYNLVLDALGRNGKLDEALNLFDRMLKEHNPPRRITVNLGTFNVMVDAYCIAGRFQDAITVFGQMGEQKCVPDTLSYNNLIDQLGSNKIVAEAEVLYKEMSERGISPDEFTYVLLVEACFGVDRVDDATGYFQKMVESGLRPNATAYNKVIGGLVNVAQLDEAKKFFDQMLEKEVKPNVSSYELLLKGFVDAERLDDGLKTLKDLLLDDGATLSEEMKGFVEEALKKEGREEEMGKLLEDVEREKAERLAREAEEKARAEALAREEEENKKKEAAEKEAAAAKASAAAIEAILGRKKDEQASESSADSKSADAVIEGEILPGARKDGDLNEEEKLRVAHDSQQSL